MKLIPERIICSRLGINRTETLQLRKAGGFTMKAKPSSGPSSSSKTVIVGSRFLSISYPRRVVWIGIRRESVQVIF